MEFDFGSKSLTQL